MPRSWNRSVSVNQNSFGYYGYVGGPILTPGDTVLRTFWSFNAWGLWGTLDTFPPGSSICRAGIVLSDVTNPSPPTPITNIGADWMDLTTVTPIGQIATSTNVDWSYQWTTGPSDRDSKVHREVAAGAGSYFVLLSWEFQVAPDAVSGFGVAGWNASIDCYIDTH